MGYKDLTGNQWLKGLKQEEIMFECQAHMVEAMQSKEYATDPTYRDVVTRMIANGEAAKAAQSGPLSGQDLNRAMADRPAARKAQDAEILREQTAAMFGDPRYATSPTYRREVENWLRENNDALDAVLPVGTLTDRNQSRGAFRIEIGKDSDQFQAIKQGMRDKEAAQAAEDRKAAHERIDAGQSADVYDVTGRKI